jgi:hypothetical protein
MLQRICLRLFHEAGLFPGVPVDVSLDLRFDHRTQHVRVERVQLPGPRPVVVAILDSPGVSGKISSH